MRELQATTAGVAFMGRSRHATECLGIPVLALLLVLEKDKRLVLTNERERSSNGVEWISPRRWLQSTS